MKRPREKRRFMTVESEVALAAVGTRVSTSEGLKIELILQNKNATVYSRLLELAPGVETS